MKIKEELMTWLKKLEQIPRQALALIAWALILILVPGFFSGWLGIRLSFSLAIWAFVMSFSIRPFMLSVSEFTDVVTINLLTGDLKKYGTGLWFRYPWEQAKAGNYIDLRLHPLGGEESYPAKDGPVMDTSWQAPYRVKDSVKFVGVGREVTEDVVKKGVSAVLSAYIAHHEADQVKARHEKIEEAIRKKLDNANVEEECGIEIPFVSLADLDYDQETQKVRTTEYVMRKLKKIAGELKKDFPNISDKDAMNGAMIVHKDLTKHINEVEGEGGNALAALLMAMAQGGGKTSNEKGDQKNDSSAS